MNFQVGEIVILQRLGRFAHLNGEETTIISFYVRNGVPCAWVSTPHPEAQHLGKSSVALTCLRKRHDPQQAARIYEGLVRRLTKGVSA